MIPTPEQVIPLISPVVGPLRDNLRAGIGYADGEQPDESDRDSWFWSHGARWKARDGLRRSDLNGFVLKETVPNCGIHLGFGGLHKVRVLRSLRGTTPHPGPNKARRAAWVGVSVQGQFQFANADSEALPPLSLIIDWQEANGEPELHVGLPLIGWAYKNSARLHWRVPLRDGGIELANLMFDAGDDDGSGLLTLNVDPREEDAT